MSLSKGARWLVPGIVLSGLLLTAAPSAEPSKVESLGKARLDAARSSSTKPGLIINRPGSTRIRYTCGRA